MNTSTICILALLVALLLWAVFAFNRLVRLRNQMRAAWADIDVQLTRRHDLVPQLVAAVKGYASHEHTLLEEVSRLRTQAVSQTTPTELSATEHALEQSVARILLLREAYPELKASENFVRLQRDLVEIESHLQYSRRFYNGAVRDLNDAIQRFPDLVIARAFGFAAADFFQADAQSRPAVSLEMTP